MLLLKTTFGKTHNRAALINKTYLNISYFNMTEEIVIC